MTKGAAVGAVIGDLLPLAIGVAISPIPIIAVILMLMFRQASRTSVGFLVGWVAGIVMATTVVPNLLMCVGAGTTIGAGHLSAGGEIVRSRSSRCSPQAQWPAR